MTKWKTIVVLSTFLIACADGKSSADNSGTGQDTGTVQGTEPETKPDTADTVPVIWSGDPITVTKEDDADHTDPANQDALTERVILTRGDQGSLMNVVVETSADSSSPAGTEWAIGRTDDLDELAFDSLKGAANGDMKDVPGVSFVLHLIEDDIYVDVTFVSWTAGDSGGGFRYERSTEN